MQKVLTAAEMSEADRLTVEHCAISSITLMERAAQAVASRLVRKLGGSIKGRHVLVLCGKGNNGGDGAALARILRERGAFVSACLFGKISETRGDARVNFRALGTEGTSAEGVCFSDPIELREITSYREWEAFFAVFRDRTDVFVDAIFGTGLTRPIDNWLADVVRDINDVRGLGSGNPLKIAVDLPSGLNADSGAFSGPHIAADMTVTFTALKAANVLPPAYRCNGETIVADIGTPAEYVDQQPSQLFCAERSDVSRWLKRSEFSPDSYKNKRGHALIVAGSANYSGAAALCGNSAMRSGAGLVTIGTPRSTMNAVTSRLLPEVMIRPLSETESGAVSEEAAEEIGELMASVDAIAIGSGLSAQEATTERFVRRMVADRRVPAILDADALTLISPFEASEHFNNSGAPPLILTPHEGEFLRMLGTKDKNAINDRVAAVRTFSQKHGVILVLKGERVLIGEPHGRVVVNPTGNSGLGKAGNGDTLTGVIVGFVAQASAMGIDIFETVVAAVYTAGFAGDLAEKKFGKRVMAASDVRECLSAAFEELACDRVTDQSEQ